MALSLFLHLKRVMINFFRGLRRGPDLSRFEILTKGSVYFRREILSREVILTK
jgi:hypothetical protein